MTDCCFHGLRELRLVCGENHLSLLNSKMELNHVLGSLETKRITPPKEILKNLTALVAAPLHVTTPAHNQTLTTQSRQNVCYRIPWFSQPTVLFFEMIRWVLELHHINGKKAICKIMGENPRSPIRKGHKMSDCPKRFLIGNEKQNESDKRHNKANSCYWALTQLRFWCDLIVSKISLMFYHHHKKADVSKFWRANRVSAFLLGRWI